MYCNHLCAVAIEVVIDVAFRDSAVPIGSRAAVSPSVATAATLPSPEILNNTGIKTQPRF